MNDIGFGIICFGDKMYHEEAYRKMHEILDYGYDCYILTDDPDFFHFNTHTILYDREVKSYHDKILLAKHLLRNNNIGILIDADLTIKDYSFLSDLETYTFKPGISYVDILLNHPSRKRFVKELDMSRRQWKSYKTYVNSIYPEFGELELIWEYFLVFNWEDSNYQNFFQHFERLQISKEFSEIHSDGVIGCGEGISISIASKLSETPCKRDYELYNVIKDKMSNVSRKFVRDDNK